MDHRS